MAYRDDQDALHERVQQMERDLDRARREAAEGKQAQHEVDQLHKALSKAQRELERLRRPKPTNPQRRTVALLAGVAGALVLAGAVAAFVLVRSPPTRVTAAAIPSSPAARPTPTATATPASLPKTGPAEAEDAPAVRGSIDKEVIRRVIRAHVGQVKGCYEKGLKSNPGLSGRVTVQMTIGAGGRVVASSVQQSTLNDGAVESCITAAVRRWVFPRPAGGGIVVVSYPFVLRTAP